MLKRMKRFVMDRFYKEEFQVLIDKTKKRIEAEGKLYSKDLEAKCNILYKIFKYNKNAVIGGFERNNNEHELFVFIDRKGPNIYIIMYGADYPKPPMITARIFDEYLYIDDIDMVRNEIGNGSIAMKYLIKTANEIGVPFIKGNISPVDKDHFDRLEHYYKKFGFKVKFNKERTGGTLKLELNTSKISS